MRRYAGWAAMGMILVLWSAASAYGFKGEEPHVLPLSRDIQSLQGLADNLLEEDGRLWVVTLHTSSGFARWSGSDREEALAWIASQSETMKAGKAAAWYVNLQGTIAEGRSVEDLWERIESGSLETERIEYYTEGTTQSRAYFSHSSPFTAAVGEGEGQINLQAAVHLDTEAGTWRITVGTPAILIEF